MKIARFGTVIKHVVRIRTLCDERDDRRIVTESRSAFMSYSLRWCSQSVGKKRVVIPIQAFAAYFILMLYFVNFRVEKIDNQ